ncbi:MAG: ACT domain-containing protein [Bariatricus sp.]|nr:ACT domain-containing protein [Bariatricus sp.]
MKKCIITVVGKDSVGIIAKVCTYLAEININVLNISQTIVDGYFNMMAVVDVEESKKELDIVSVELRDLGLQIGVNIHCQREEIFQRMHRL